MKRRDFLKTLAAGSLAVTLPLYAKLGSFHGSITNFSTEILLREEDFGHGLGIAVKLVGENDEVYRQGYYVDEWSWIKESGDAVRILSREAAKAFSGWIDSNPELNGYMRPTKEQIFDAIALKYDVS